MLHTLRRAAAARLGGASPAGRPTRRSLATSARAAAAAGGEPAPAPHLLVFGGNGFVGSRICERALATGLGVVSVSRSGSPPLRAGGGGPGAPAAPPAWAADVEWLAADAGDTASWAPALDGCVGVISTLGAFGSNAHMRRVCGELNSTVFEAAAAAAIPRAAFISVHPFGFPGFVLPGYFGGKADAEETLFRLFPRGGVALRPGFIYGTRHVGASGLGLPLGAVGAPLEAALGALGPAAKSLAGVPIAGAAFVPPVSVDAVARAAVAAATDPSVPPGPMSVWEIRDRDAPTKEFLLFLNASRPPTSKFVVADLDDTHLVVEPRCVAELEEAVRARGDALTYTAPADPLGG